MKRIIKKKRERKNEKKKITKKREEKREKVSQLFDFDVAGETQFNQELLTH